MKKFKIIATLSMAAALAACGGGGDDDNATTPPNPETVSNTAEGLWVGTTSTGRQARIAVLENGETWGFYFSNSSLDGALYGNTSVTGSALSGTGLDFYNGKAHVGSYTGTVSSKNSITVTTTQGTSFSGTYSATYDQPASLAAIAGTFSGYGATAESSPVSTSVSISDSGALTAGNVYCSISGTVTPRPSGKNVFNLSVTFAGNYCAFASGTTVNGIAYYDNQNRTLMAMGLNSGKNDGFIYIGTK